MKMTISGTNEGKEFEVSQINVDALDYLTEIKKKGDPGVRDIVLIALMSCDDLTIQPDKPNYVDTLRLWARRMDAVPALELVTNFMEINKSFLLKAGVKVPETLTSRS